MSYVKRKKRIEPCAGFIGDIDEWWYRINGRHGNNPHNYRMILNREDQRRDWETEINKNNPLADFWFEANKFYHKKHFFRYYEQP